MKPVCSVVCTWESCWSFCDFWRQISQLGNGVALLRLRNTQNIVYPNSHYKFQIVCKEDEFRSTEGFEACWSSHKPTTVRRRLLEASIVDLTFRILTCCFLLAIVSLTWDLVCINLSFAISCVRAPLRSRNNLDYALHHSVLSIGVDTTLSERVELCIASARTTLAVSAVAPS